MKKPNTGGVGGEEKNDAKASTRKFGLYGALKENEKSAELLGHRDGDKRTTGFGSKFGPLGNNEEVSKEGRKGSVIKMSGFSKKKEEESKEESNEKVKEQDEGENKEEGTAEGEEKGGGEEEEAGDGSEQGGEQGKPEIQEKEEVKQEGNQEVMLAQDQGPINPETAFQNAYKGKELKAMTNLKKIGSVHGAMNTIHPEEEIQYNVNVWRQEILAAPPRFHVDCLKVADKTEGSNHKEDTDSEGDAAEEIRRMDKVYQQKKSEKGKKVVNLILALIFGGIGSVFLVIGVVGKFVKFKPKPGKLKKAPYILAQSSIPMMAVGSFGVFLCIVGLVGTCRGVNYLKILLEKSLGDKKRTSRLLLILINVAVMAGGITYLALGIRALNGRQALAKSMKEKPTSDEKHQSFYIFLMGSPPIICAFSGIFSFLGLLGTIAAGCKVIPLLLLYTLMMTPVIATQAMVFGAFLFTSEEKGEFYMKKWLIQEYRGGTGYPHGKYKLSSHSRSAILDTFQFVLPCCGVTGFQDFRKSRKWNHKNHCMGRNGPSIIKSIVPLSCCRLKYVVKHDRPTVLVFENLEGCLQSPSNKTAHRWGCYKMAKHEVKKNILDFILLLGGEIFVVYLSNTLAKILRKEREDFLKQQQFGKPEMEEMKGADSQDVEAGEIIDDNGKKNEKENPPDANNEKDNETKDIIEENIDKDQSEKDSILQDNTENVSQDEKIDEDQSASTKPRGMFGRFRKS